MSADDADRVSGFPFGTDGEGNDGRGVPGKVVLATGLDSGGPVIPFPDLLEASSFEELHGGSDSMIGCMHTGGHDPGLFQISFLVTQKHSHTHTAKLFVSSRKVLRRLVPDSELLTGG